MIQNMKMWNWNWTIVYFVVTTITRLKGFNNKSMSNQIKKDNGCDALSAINVSKHLIDNQKKELIDQSRNALKPNVHNVFYTI